MKKLILSITILFTAIFAYAQNWQTVGAPFCYNEGCGCTSAMCALTTYNGKLYAGGYADNGVVNGIGSWDGAKWDTLAGGLQGQSFVEVFSMCVYNGYLYAGGNFYTIGHVNAVNNIAAWNGTSWARVASGLSLNAFVYAMAVYNGNLYVAGSFDSAGGVRVNNIAMWNGSIWSAVGSGIGYLSASPSSPSSGVFSLAVYNGNLYAGGLFDSAGGVPAENIAMWNGSVWSSIGGGIPTGTRNYPSSSGPVTWPYQVNSLCALNGNLYVGGLFDSAGNINAANIASWNGTSWAPLGVGLWVGDGGGSLGHIYGVLSLYGYNNVLFAGGAFYKAGGVPASAIAQWNGTSWSAIGTGFTGTPYGNHVPCESGITVYNNNLYADGSFDSASGIQTCSMSQWTGPLSVNELKPDNSSTSLFPNPNNGRFTIELQGVRDKEQVEIYNMLGEKIYSETVNTKHLTLNINVSGQPAGIYLYRVISETGEQIANGKFVIE
jgi:hypothetical protein